MIRIYRVALREYMENAKTKGFWIGILLFPLMIWLMLEVPRFLEEKGIPTRHVIIVANDDVAGDISRQRLTLLNRQKSLSSLQQHLAKETADQRAEMLENTEFDAAELLEKLEEGLSQISPDAGAINPFNPEQLVEIGDLVPDEMLLNDFRWKALKNLLISQLPEGSAAFVEPEL